MEPKLWYIPCVWIDAVNLIMCEKPLLNIHLSKSRSAYAAVNRTQTDRTTMKSSSGVEWKQTAVGCESCVSRAVQISLKLHYSHDTTTLPLTIAVPWGVQQTDHRGELAITLRMLRVLSTICTLQHSGTMIMTWLGFVVSVNSTYYQTLDCVPVMQNYGCMYWIIWNNIW